MVFHAGPQITSFSRCESYSSIQNFNTNAFWTIKKFLYILIAQVWPMKLIFFAASYLIPIKKFLCKESFFARITASSFNHQAAIISHWENIPAPSFSFDIFSSTESLRMEYFQEQNCYFLLWSNSKRDLLWSCRDADIFLNLRRLSF